MEDPVVTVNRPSLSNATGCAASRLEAVEQQLDSTLERLVWRRQPALGLEPRAPVETLPARRRRRAASNTYPRLFVIGSSVGS
jgi:hypothetical protein